MGITNDELLKCTTTLRFLLVLSTLCLILLPQIRSCVTRFIKTIIAYTKRNISFCTQRMNSTPIQQMELFYHHLKTTLDDIGFIIRKHPGNAMTRLKRLFNRTRPETKELRMLRGILSAAQKHVR